MAQDTPDTPRGRPCMVCGARPASFGLGWPGYRDQHPHPIRGARPFRHCGEVECAAQGIARMIAAARAAFPWSETCYPQEVRDRVAEIRGEPAEAPRAPSPSTVTPSETEPQRTLI